MDPNYTNPRALFSAVLELDAREREALFGEVAVQSPELVESVRGLLRAHRDAEAGEFFPANPCRIDPTHERD